MPHLPRWMRRLRPFATPIWVLIGIGVSIGVYQTLIGKFFDDEVLNAPNLFNETIQHIYISGVSFAIVAAIGVSIGVYQTLIGKFFDDEVLNAPNLFNETIQHIYISGVSFAIVAAIG